MAALAINQTIWRLFSQEKLTVEQIAASLDLSSEAVEFAISQMPITKNTPEDVAGKAKEIFKERQELLAEKLSELALQGETEVIQFQAAKFALLFSSGHFDPKKDAGSNGGFSPVTINNYIMQAAEAYKAQPGLIDISSTPVSKEPDKQLSLN